MVTVINCDLDLEEYFWLSAHLYFKHLVEQHFLACSCPRWQHLTGALLQQSVVYLSFIEHCPIVEKDVLKSLVLVQM